MADILSKDDRSALMKRVRRSDTTPELALRKRLHAAGLRYSLHKAKLPGKPDLVLPKHCAVVFVHGCFWHGHDCRAGRAPSSNKEFWVDKIARNRARDARQVQELRQAGWRVFVVWECETKPARVEASVAALVESIHSKGASTDAGGGQLGTSAVRNAQEQGSDRTDANPQPVRAPRTTAGVRRGR